MLFLATPHHGSDMAAFLYTTLQLALTPRAYIDDLRANSIAIKRINGAFSHYASKLTLWSFYETQPLRLTLFRKLIVEEHSAVLNYPYEKRTPVNADHRSICKFESSTDPNYLIIRNAICVVIGSVLGQKAPASPHTTHPELQQPQPHHDRDQMRIIREFLKYEEDPYDDLIAVEDARLAGTCQWFFRCGSFLKWKNGQEDTPGIYWLKGAPGSGKSVLAGSIIGDLEESARSYFFFKDGHEKQSRLCYCLRSLAFQMASVSSEVRQAIIEIWKRDTKLDCDSSGVIWRKIFVSGIFTCSLKGHFWVIDGIDECDDISPLFDSMLGKLRHTLDIRILFTSRNDSELTLAFQELGNGRVLFDELLAGDNSADIWKYIDQKSRVLHASNEESRLELVSEIFNKTQGSFLWTVSILRELSQAYGDREIRQVLNEVPSGMEGFYTRILKKVMGTIKNKEVMRGILLWVACAARPLTVQALQDALEIGLKKEVPNLEERIRTIFGQLLSIDTSGRIRVFHLTVMEFLSRGDLIQDAFIDGSEAHTQIARSCLLCLSGSDFRSLPRTQSSSAVSKPQRMEFSKYACESFSDHLSRASPDSNELFHLVDSFLQGNILSWIEYIAYAGDVSFLFQVSKDLERYYTACVIARRSPLEMHILKSWIADLIRIAMGFSQALLLCPSAIYAQIGPFCPTESAIHR